jgi:hypothetical protein
LALLERSNGGPANGEPQNAAPPPPEEAKEPPRKDDTTRITVY